VKLTSVPGHMGIDGNEIGDKSARQIYSHPLRGHEPAIGINSKVARRVIRDSISRKHEEHWQFTRGQRQAKDYLKKKKTPLCKKELGIAQPEQKLVKNINRAGKKDTAN